MIVLYVLAGLVLLLGTASVVAYFKLAVPAMRNAKPIPDDDVRFCREIVRQGKGFPWVCTQALKSGRCPCQPCQKVAKARSEVAGRCPCAAHPTLHGTSGRSWK